MAAVQRNATITRHRYAPAIKTTAALNAGKKVKKTGGKNKKRS